MMNSIFISVNQISHIYIVENVNRYIDSGFGSKEKIIKPYTQMSTDNFSLLSSRERFSHHPWN